MHITIPPVEDVSEVIKKFIGLKEQIEKIKDVAENGEDPEKAEADSRKAEEFFRELRETWGGDRSFGPTVIRPNARTRIDALIDGGKSPSRIETWNAIMQEVQRHCEDLPISILRRVQTEVIPEIWGCDSQKVTAGLTAADIKGFVMMVQGSKELELQKQLRTHIERVINEVDLILCPYQEFLQQEPDSTLIQSTDHFAFVDASIHRHKRIKRRLEVKAQQQAAEACQGQAEKVKRKTGQRHAKTTLDRASEKFQPWRNPGDACFIIDHKANTRLLFQFRGEYKDLSLRSHSHALDLMTSLAAGSLRSDEIKTQLNLGRTKPSKVVARANELLNKKVAEKGFAGVPDNTEFIRRDEFGCYISALTIQPSLEDFEHNELQQPLVDDRWQNDIDVEGSSF